MCFDCFCMRAAEGVCLVKSRDAHQEPSKVKVSAVTHRLGCRFGLCTVTDLVAFTFSKPRLMDQLVNARAREEVGAWGHHQWTSRRAVLDLDLLLKHRAKEAVRVAITWRRRLACHYYDLKPIPVYLPMDAFLHQVWPDISHERPFTFTLWLGEGGAHGLREIGLMMGQEQDEEEDKEEEEEEKEEEEEDIEEIVERFWSAAAEGEDLTVAVEEVPLVFDREQRYWHAGAPPQGEEVARADREEEQRRGEKRDRKEEDGQTNSGKETLEKDEALQERKEERTRVRDVSSGCLGRESVARGEAEGKNKVYMDTDGNKQREEQVEGVMYMGRAGEEDEEVGEREMLIRSEGRGNKIEEKQKTQEEKGRREGAAAPDTPDPLPALESTAGRGVWGLVGALVLLLVDLYFIGK